MDQAVGLPEADARWFFQQLVLGLDFCHRLGIAHQVGGAPLIQASCPISGPYVATVWGLAASRSQHSAGLGNWHMCASRRISSWRTRCWTGRPPARCSSCATSATLCATRPAPRAPSPANAPSARPTTWWAPCLPVQGLDVHQDGISCAQPGQLTQTHSLMVLACHLQAPELLLSPTSYDGKAADVWAAGVLLYTLLCGARLAV